MQETSGVTWETCISAIARLNSLADCVTNADETEDEALGSVIKKCKQVDDFFRAIRSGDYDTVSRLVLQYGACTDTSGHTPLMCAIASKQEDILPILTPSSSGMTTENGDYAITLAAELEFLPGVLATLPYEHQYRNRDGDSALHILARKGIVDIIPQCAQYLERARDATGRLPIDVAAEHNNVAFLKASIENKLGLTADDVLRTFCAARHAGKQEAMDCLREYIFVEPVECVCYRCSNVLDFPSNNSSRLGTPIVSRYSSICRTPLSFKAIRSLGSLSAERKPSLHSPCLSPRLSSSIETISIGIQVSVSCQACAESTQMYQQQIAELNDKLLALTAQLNALSQKSPHMNVSSPHCIEPNSASSEKKNRQRNLVEAATLSLSPLQLASEAHTKELISVVTPTVKKITTESHPNTLDSQLRYSSSRSNPEPNPTVLRFSGFRGITELALSQVGSLKDSSQHVEDMGSVFDAPNMHTNMTDLMRAACSGNVGLVGKLIAIQSRQQTESGHTALMFACRIGNLAAAKMLLPYEAGMQTNTGSTALMEACAGGSKELAELLLAEGGIYRKDGWSALMSAARAGLPDIVRCLLPIEGGRTTLSGVTALMKAVEQGHYSCISILMPSEIYLRRRDGRTAIDIARELSNTGIIGLLEEYIKTHPPPSSSDNKTIIERSRNQLTSSEMELLIDIDEYIAMGDGVSENF